MAQIGISPEVRTLALELANLGRLAEATCVGFSTEASIIRLISELRSGKGKFSKLERALKARLASERAAAKEAARLRAAQHKPSSRASLVGA